MLSTICGIVRGAAVTIHSCRCWTVQKTGREVCWNVKCVVEQLISGIISIRTEVFIPSVKKNKSAGTCTGYVLDITGKHEESRTSWQTDCSKVNKLQTGVVFVQLHTLARNKLSTNNSGWSLLHCYFLNIEVESLKAAGFSSRWRSLCLKPVTCWLQEQFSICAIHKGTFLNRQTQIINHTNLSS